MTPRSPLTSGRRAGAARGGVRRGQVLGFGTYDVRRHPRVGVLLAGLRRHGWAVTELTVPLELGTDQRIAALRGPLALAGAAVTAAGTWGRLVLSSRPLRRGPDPEVVVVGYLGHLDVLLARRLFPASTLVLDHLTGAAETARDRGVRGGVRLFLLDRLDRAATGAADVVVVDTEEQRAGLPAAARPRAVVIRVGAGDAWFVARRPADDVDPEAPLRVVWFGAYTPLHGAPVLARALALLADRGVRLDVTLVGDGQDRDRAQELAPTADSAVRITWRDWVDPARLPDLVAAHDVAVGIVGDTPKARRVVPTKAFQSMAAGCALVTADTPPQRRLLGDDAVLVPPGDPETLADALQALADDRPRVIALRAAAGARADRDFRAEAVVRPLVALLGDPTAPEPEVLAHAAR
ncbi:MAG: glycosyltransferase family 4 protein [Candidatus Nanopelagicales bacterium]